jgi:ankyrin repeat protein
MLGQNVNINEVDGSNQTGLNFIFFDSLGLIVLTKKHVRFFYKRTALHHAARLGHIDIVEFLLQNGANVNAQTVQGKTPLHQGIGFCFFSFCATKSKLFFSRIFRIGFRYKRIGQTKHIGY